MSGRTRRQLLDWRKPPRWLTALGILLVVWGAYLTGFLRFADQELEDLRFRLVGREATADLVIVAIDARSLQELSVWPWPRRYHAQVLRNLAAAGATRIAVDVDFSSHSALSEDLELAAALAESPVPVLLPVFKQRQQVADGQVLVPTEPIDRFARVAELGSINVRPDADGQIREMATADSWWGEPVATLSSWISPVAPPDVTAFHLDFGIDAMSIPVISFADVYAGRLDPALVAGRRVLIGATAIELGDMLPVPVYRALPGVLLHALAAQSLIQQRALQPLRPAAILLLTALVALAFGPRFARWPWWRGLAVCLLGMLACVLLAMLAQALWPVLVDVAPLIFLLGLLYFSGLVGRLNQQDLRLLMQGLAIRRKDAFMRELVENSFDGILTIDKRGLVISYNSSAARMFDLPREQIVGKDVGLIVSSRDRPRGTPTARQRMLNPGGPHELTAVRGDGTEFPIHVVVSEMRTNEEPLSIAFVRDISEWKYAEAQAEQARKRLQEAIECISEGFALYDADDRLVLCNSKFRDGLQGVDEVLTPGWRFEDALRVIAQLRVHNGLLSAEEPEAWLARRLERHRNPAGAFEEQLLDASYVMVSERRTHDGGIVGVYTDITEMKRREARLEAATREAEAANKSKSEFLANMSHELRTPLNAIIGFSEIIGGEAMGPVGTPQYKEYAGDITESGKHLLGIVNDILDVSRIEAGEYKLSEEPIEICEVIRSSLRLVRLRAAEARHELEAEIPEERLVVLADERALKQVMINLLGNAIKFTPEGGRIVVSLRHRPGEGLSIAVQDNGIGIAADDIPKALAFFGQVDSKLAREYEGTGLGLPLARNLVELQGGSFALESAVGIGTTVTVTFPPERVLEAGRPGPARQAAAG